MLLETGNLQHGCSFGRFLSRFGSLCGLGCPMKHRETAKIQDSPHEEERVCGCWLHLQMFVLMPSGRSTITGGNVHKTKAEPFLVLPLDES